MSPRGIDDDWFRDAFDELPSADPVDARPSADAIPHVIASVSNATETPFPRRSWYASTVASTGLHAVGMLLLASWWAPKELLTAATTGVDTAWTAESRDEPLERIASSSFAVTPSLLLPGGSDSPRRTFVATATVAERWTLAAPDSQVVAATVWLPSSDAASIGDPTEDVGALRIGSGTGDGTGQGAGSGDGVVAPASFFGIRPVGQRFVYVVDCSGSMNAPHDSDAKTRFRRVKLEILKSVSAMHPGQQFFIVFFNDQPHPMPAPALQSATPQAKQRFLEWMARSHAIGETDPRGALLLALRLQPDVIYFLTDGSFVKKVERELLQLRQSQSSLHTFAFGNRHAEQVLKAIAEANGGEFHFVE